MRNFQQYKLEHFISLHYYEGGLATSQVLLMFNHIIEEKNEEMKFQAALQGISLGKDTSSGQSPGIQENPDVPMFGDPDSYAGMSAEERQSLTEKMMAKHKNWVATK